MQAVCQTSMHGGVEFEEALLQLDSPEPSQADENKALTALKMFILDCTGTSSSKTFPVNDPHECSALFCTVL